MNWEHLMKPVRHKRTFAFWGIGKDQPIVQVVRRSQRISESNDSRAMRGWAAERRDAAVLGDRRLTRAQQMQRAFHRQKAYEVGEVM